LTALSGGLPIQRLGRAGLNSPGLVPSGIVGLKPIEN
jgi:hypothetical protein